MKNVLVALMIAFCFVCLKVQAYEMKWINPLPGGISIFSIWGDSPDNIYYIGHQGAVLHYNGTDYSFIDIGYYLNLNGISGNSSSNVYIACDSGYVVHWNGNIWQLLPRLSSDDLNGIWVADSGDVFVVGDRGLLAKWDGADWIFTYIEDAAVDFKGIWGFDENDVFAVGCTWNLLSEYTIYHWDGNDWQPQEMSEGSCLYSVWGVAHDDVYAVGDIEYGGIRHFDGNSWTEVNCDVFPTLMDIWVDQQTSTVFAAGFQGTIVMGEAGVWQGESVAPNEDFWSIWGYNANNIITGGLYGTLYQYNGSDWEKLQKGPNDDFLGIAISDDCSIYVVGYEGKILRKRGDIWDILDSGVGTTLWDVCCISQNEVYAVGDEGVILKWDGSVWTKMYSGTTYSLRHIYGDHSTGIYVAGFGGTVLVLNDSQWMNLDTGFSRNIYGIWASGMNDVFAVGENSAGESTILHWDGFTWVNYDNNFNVTLYDIWGFDANNVYAVGEISRIYHWDGSMWSKENTSELPTVHLQTVHGVDDRLVFVAGIYGQLWMKENGVWSHVKTQTESIFMDIGESNSNILACGTNGTILEVILNPEPTCTPAPSPTTTPSPCAETGVEIFMPAHVFYPGDTCSTTACVCNAAGQDLVGYPLFVILYIYDSYYFAPAFSESLDNYLQEYPAFSTGETIVEVIPEFFWPSNAGAFNGAILIAALTDPGITSLFGKWGYWEFGWHE